MSTALVIGESLIDVVNDAERVSEHPGGSPLNVAVGLARLGREVELATWIGLDAPGRNIESYVGADNIHLSGFSRGASRTSTAIATLDELVVNLLTIGDSSLYPTADAPGVSRFTTATATIYGTLRLRNSCFIAGNIHLDADTVANNAHFYTSGKEIYVWFGNAVNRTNQTLYKLTKTAV